LAGRSHYKAWPWSPYHPQGKVERWHQTLKTATCWKNYPCPEDSKARSALSSITIHNRRHHESLGNVTPADTYFGRDTTIIERRNRIKTMTKKNRRFNHQRKAD